MEFCRYPERELCEKSRDWSDLRVVMEEGIGPEKKLDRRVKVWRLEREEIEEGIEPKKLLSERSSVVSCVSREIRGVSVPEYPAGSRVIWLIVLESGVQVRPQMKLVRRGSEQGSVVKFHEARQDQGAMDDGLMEALKAPRAAMSEGEVRAWTRTMVFVL
ncbi:uncharacterized protein HKW66_Vig0196660 [Vigna angularis]|uniref:Uncharacterized protein n=1 Tax=Phaseolus angularis TaxID=3914 RepID=A0A8T0KQA1_PHAAN|nr:uncharacterized protein HKW66_Vig0196660 [Vigna angularis]